jgi:hypothetical protein
MSREGRGVFRRPVTHSTGEMWKQRHISVTWSRFELGTCWIQLYEVKIAVFWDVMPCCFVDMYQRYGGTFFYLEVPASRFPWNAGTHGQSRLHVATSQKTLSFMFTDVRTSDSPVLSVTANSALRCWGHDSDNCRDKRSHWNTRTRVVNGMVIASL